MNWKVISKYKNPLNTCKYSTEHTENVISLGLEGPDGKQQERESSEDVEVKMWVRAKTEARQATEPKQES